MMSSCILSRRAVHILGPTEYWAPEMVAMVVVFDVFSSCLRFYLRCCLNRHMCLDVFLMAYCGCD